MLDHSSPALTSFMSLLPQPLFDTFECFHELNFLHLSSERPVVQEYLKSFDDSSMKDLQADLRHNSLSTTQNTYYNSLDGQRARSVKGLIMRR
jgi:hypothetical protein